MVINTELLQRLTNFAQKHALITRDQTIIVGLSGGPDSLFLFYFLKQIQQEYNLTLIAAHLDHGWRSNSTDDVLFCKTVAENLNIECISAHASEIKIDKIPKGSLEEQGRLLRRTFFKNIAQQHQNSCIALGHHADDQQETFFIRLLRGSGVTGLAGINPKDGVYIHPLLCCTKQEIITTLEHNNISFLIDQTNESEQFLRNRIRLNVIPSLRICDARFDESLNRTMDNLRETDDFLIQHTKKIFEACTNRSYGKTWLNCETFFEQHEFMQKKILLHWFITENVIFTPSSGLFKEVLQFFKNSKSQKHTLYGSWSIIKKGTYVTIEHVN